MSRRPNYNFEKRRKELARKQRQEEKRARKREGGPRVHDRRFCWRRARVYRTVAHDSGHRDLVVEPLDREVERLHEVRAGEAMQAPLPDEVLATPDVDRAQ